MTKYNKILVTGADGFIGSHLVEHLLKQGHSVRALSYYNSFNYWGWLEDVPQNPKLEIVSGDIRDPFFCRKITAEVDAVFHLAALIAIPFSYVAPQSYIDTNVAGTLNICQAAYDNKVKKIIHTSTSEVYGTAIYVPIDEKHPLQPQSPYSASKIGADAIAKSFYYSFNLPVVIARPFNTYGPRQSARAVIPTIITQLLNGANNINLGDVTPTRDFNFVEDTCQGFYELLLSEEVNGEEVNIGSGTEISIEDLFHKISHLMNKKATLEIDKNRIRPANSEVKRLLCDNSKIKKLTNFHSKHSLDEGLKKTIEWFSQEQNLRKYKSGIYNI